MFQEAWETGFYRAKCRTPLTTCMYAPCSVRVGRARAEDWGCYLTATWGQGAEGKVSNTMLRHQVQEAKMLKVKELTGIPSRQGCRYMALPSLSVWAYGAHTIKGVPAWAGNLVYDQPTRCGRARSSTYPRWELFTAPFVTPPIPFAFLKTIDSGSVCDDRAY